jgi:hypothetical protein|tara:strand:- start:30 stop:788 length:759 start_codon:yes stop_codon:yes gene_type:complete
MGLAKTFTNSIVREIGRNYGKAASNHLLGDRHSTPHRLVSNNDVTRKRGKLYHNDFDKSIKKFEIKGAQATFNQVLNIHSSYFALVEEANADGVIDLTEMSFLIEQTPRAMLVLKRAKSALADMNKPDFETKTEEKIESLREFVRSLNDALDLSKLSITKPNPTAIIFLFLSVIALDRIYFSPKRIMSYILPFLCVTSIGFYSVIYLLFVNPSSPYGYWGYKRTIKLQKLNNKLAISIKEYLQKQVLSYEVQ